MTEPPTAAVQAAIDRRLAKQRDDAAREVEVILDAALRVAERMAPVAPRVADIVAEAGTSNQGFYRYFAGKDDLMNAVGERGAVRLRTYLEHQLAKRAEPRQQVAAWIRGMLRQATDRRAARQSAAINLQLTDRDIDPALADGLRALLDQPLAALGSTDPSRDAEVIFEAVFGTVRHHLLRGSSPSAADGAHLIAFCLRGVAG